MYVAGMREVGVVIVQGCPEHWHDPPGSSSVSIPDDRGLWEVIWDLRDRIDGVAHTHPGTGFPSPSLEDLTTFMAVEAGLGRRLLWWIVSSGHASLCTWSPATSEERGELGYDVHFLHSDEEPWWAEELRERSFK